LQVTDASVDPRGVLRVLQGYVAQSQVVLGSFEIFAGASITRVLLTDGDRATVADPTDASGTRQIIPHSVLRYQLGVDGGVVYNVSPAFHLDLDYFRAEAAWVLGERQVLHTLNGGVTFSW
jgi:hypothetical protein